MSAADFTPIGESLRGLVFSGLGVVVQAVPPDLKDLMDLEPTASYEGRMLLYQTALRERTHVNGMPKDRMLWPGWLRGKMRMTQVLLDKARQRDVLASTRPEGCWCLGRGYRRIAKDYHEPWSWSAIQVAALDKINDYCACADGRKAFNEHHRKRQAFQHEQAAERVERLWQSVAIPEKFEHLTLQTLLERDPSRQAMVDVLNRWEKAAGKRDEHGELCDWLLLTGAVGLGKTGILAALLKRAIGRGQSALFVDAPAWLDSLRETYDDDAEARESDRLKPLMQVDVLGLDDVGAHGSSAWAVGRLRRVINERYAREKRTIVTTNLTLEQVLTELDERIGSRLIGASLPVEVRGRNLRTE
jgi:DNA replication protein DnaC